MIPGRVVAGDFCRICPYADHDGAALRPAERPAPDGVPHPDMGVEDFAACCRRGGTNHFLVAILGGGRLPTGSC
jgi:hypothetical protein